MGTKLVVLLTYLQREITALSYDYKSSKLTLISDDSFDLYQSKLVTNCNLSLVENQRCSGNEVVIIPVDNRTKSANIWFNGICQNPFAVAVSQNTFKITQTNYTTLVFEDLILGVDQFIQSNPFSNNPNMTIAAQSQNVFFDDKNSSKAVLIYCLGLDPSIYYFRFLVTPFLEDCFDPVSIQFPSNSFVNLVNYQLQIQQTPFSSQIIDFSNTNSFFLATQFICSTNCNVLIIQFDFESQKNITLLLNRTQNIYGKVFKLIIQNTGNENLVFGISINGSISPENNKSDSDYLIQIIAILFLFFIFAFLGFLILVIYICNCFSQRKNHEIVYFSGEKEIIAEED